MTDLSQLAPPAVVRRAGWYPDPARDAAQRWFDGRQWTDRTRNHREGGVSPLVVLGLVLGLVFPIGGAVVAVVLLVRNQIGPGLAVALMSVVGAVVFVAITGG